MAVLATSRAGALAVLLAWAAAVLAGAVAPAAAPLDPRLAAFVAAGGSLDDICGGHHGGRGEPHCDACRLLGPAVLPDRPLAAPARGACAAAPAPVATAAARAAVLSSGRPRGPPLRS